MLILRVCVHVFHAGASAVIAVVDKSTHGWSVENLTVEIMSAPPNVKGIAAQGSDFAIRNVVVTLRQQNNSNAISVVNALRFDVSGNTLTQNNLCLWGPDAGMHSVR